MTDFKTQFICSASRKTTPYCCGCGKRYPLPGKQTSNAIIHFFNTCAGTSSATCNGCFSLMQTFARDSRSLFHLWKLQADKIIQMADGQLQTCLVTKVLLSLMTLLQFF